MPVVWSWMHGWEDLLVIVLTLDWGFNLKQCCGGVRQKGAVLSSFWLLTKVLIYWVHRNNARSALVLLR